MSTTIPSAARLVCRALSAAALAALVSGCVINGDKYKRPRDLEDGYEVNRLRLLAIRPEPPEAVPGEMVTFEVLIADPDEVVETVIWLACPLTASGDFGCNVDLDALGDDPTPEDLAAAGVIGIEPLFPPQYVPDEALLEGLDDTEVQEGVSVIIQILAFPAAEQDAEEIDFGEVAVGFKRLLVSEAITPNRNPEVAEFLVGGAVIPEDAIVAVEPGLEYTLGVRLEADSVESYQYLNSEGTIEDRVEQPYVTWYAAGGHVSEPWGLYGRFGDDPLLEGRWIAPENVGAQGTWYGVVRDRRGGMAWVVQDWLVQ
ncbi:MAG: hypothetical protein JRI25_19220 [Deltaproteobacteria bacterium]|nr:hypothetical protein [Deltaproteobacteria bacterium]MBW2256708.1 hypothetical protein [Deltaproteobacteria bacterium]